MEPVLIGSGILAIAILIIVLLILRRVRSRRSASQQAHEQAQQRDPPVELGETYQFGITEFKDHHSGTRIAVGKVEGFVIFAEDVPADATVGDVVEATVVSFNRGQTSADAKIIDSE